MILFPVDPLTPRRPDPHFLLEARRVTELGGGTVLLDHDALLAGDVREAVRGVPAGGGPLWYRGWMVPTARYAELAEALAERGRPLMTSGASYADAHELPGWYPVFEGSTPESVWLPGGPGRGGAVGEAALADAARRLGGRGPAVVKDYVKSRKHEWDEACYVPELADTSGLLRVVRRFEELQGEFLAGGVVLRRFEEYRRGADGRAVEARVWWLDGDPVLVGPHPDQPDAVVRPELGVVQPLVRSLGCRFVTTDLAQSAADGSWRVVEVGDGQVSELPRGADLGRLLTALLSRTGG
ncbi:ATP-grasp domain-containing protein [Kitasatospora sp. NPDC051853]|uniref:ATP-grasp domain-containing protein n=1 Tax=Kitasatospora sp. NPDC051853 TaxID=3364058 RepID=UPI0037ADCD8C